MSDASGWYARKMAALRGGSAAPSAPQQQYPQQQYLQRQPMRIMAADHPPQPPREAPVTIENIFNAMGHWRGGKAHKIDAQPCPECGSNQFYSRTDGVRRGPPPAPHCYNCGYNGMFQQGDPTTWGVV